MTFDHNKNDVHIWAQTMYSDNETAQYVAGTAFHWYTGSHFDNLELAHQADPNKFLLATEASICPPEIPLSNWTQGERTDKIRVNNVV